MSLSTTEIAQLWRHVNRQMHELFRSTVQQYDLPPVAYLVLRHIQKEPGINVSQLARRLGIAKSHVSNTTEHLAREGFVEKRSDPSDQRILRLYLSESAQGRLDEMGNRSQAVWTLVFEEFPEDDLQDMARLLRLLLPALERANEKLCDKEALDALTKRGV